MAASHVKPVRSIGHNNNWVSVFVDELAQETYLNMGSQFPECAKIVKPIYTDTSGSTIRKLTIMVKMPAGFDPENGNWWYGTSDASGEIVTQKKQAFECLECHQGAEDTDYLFSKEVLKAARE